MRSSIATKPFRIGCVALFLVALVFYNTYQANSEKGNGYTARFLQEERNESDANCLAIVEFSDFCNDDEECKVFVIF